MAIADLSTIRVNVWQDMSTDIIGGNNVSLGAGASNNGPGADLGLVTTGGATSYGQTVGYKPVFTANGTWICRVKFPAGCAGGSSPWYTGNQNASVICAAIQGQYWIANGNYCLLRPTNSSNVWETLVMTWGSSGLRGYRDGSLAGTNAYTGTPPTPYYDMTFGCLQYNGGYVQNISMTMDFAAILSRQLSDSEVTYLSSNYSDLWAAAVTLAARESPRGQGRGMARGMAL